MQNWRFRILLLFSCLFLATNQSLDVLCHKKVHLHLFVIDFKSSCDRLWRGTQFYVMKWRALMQIPFLGLKFTMLFGMSSSLATTDILYTSSRGALIGLWFALFDFRYWVWKFVEETFGRELASEEEVPWRVLGTEAAAQWSYLTQRQHQGLLQM